MRIEKVIFDHFGEECQYKKLKEEAGEFFEAYENWKIGADTMEHAAEELQDLMIVADQFRLFFDSIAGKKIGSEIKTQKLERTVDRIKSGYY